MKLNELVKDFMDTWQPTEEGRDDRLVILGIDPGVTTGLSALLIDLSDGLPRPNDTDKITNWTSQVSYGGSGNISDVIDSEGWEEQEIAMAIVDLVSVARSYSAHVYVVIEDFIIRKLLSSREFLSPVRVTSGIMALLRADALLPRERIFIQSPSEAKGVCTDERLDRWGYPIKTQKDRHARDATRHAVLFLRRLSASPSAASLSK